MLLFFKTTVLAKAPPIVSFLNYFKFFNETQVSWQTFSIICMVEMLLHNVILFYRKRLFALKKVLSGSKKYGVKKYEVLKKIWM